MKVYRSEGLNGLWKGAYSEVEKYTQVRQARQQHGTCSDKQAKINAKNTGDIILFDLYPLKYLRPACCIAINFECFFGIIVSH